jgi:hypothetical protein
MVNYILLADHFGVTINEFLDLAGLANYARIDIHSVDNKNLPTEAVEAVMTLGKIENPGIRKEISQAILILVEIYIQES